jgi:histidyl-tRNA synthetase
LERGLTNEDIEKINPILNLKGSIDEKIFSLKKLFSDSQIGQKGISELEEVFQNVKLLNLSLDLDFDITLARGLNYYTGAIFEVKCKDVKMGSIVGGGRYDNLTGVFGMPDVSGVGISFGADRIYDCLEELNLFPDQISASTTIIFANFGTQEAKQCLQYAKILRSKGIKTEIYPEEVKLQKQMKYANDKKIPYVALLGQKEIDEGTIVLKNMISGEQSSVTIDQIVDLLSK